MKKVLAGALITLALILVCKSCTEADTDRDVLRENSMLIEKQIKNVSKLIVTEGHFAEVYSYADSKELFGSLITADKKALVVVNAKVAISYDLSQLDFEIDEAEKTIVIKNIPEPEININPDIEYYDVSADFLNPFEANDYNSIKHKVNTSLQKKIQLSSLKENAQNRLLSELSKVLVLTNSMGWVLSYHEKPVQHINELQLFDASVAD